MSKAAELASLQGVLKCWYNLKGDSTAAIRDSLNTGSLTDNGTGDYSITFTNNMANNDYYYGTTQRANSRTAGVATESDLETSKIDNTLTFDSTGSNVDRDIQGGCVAGDLA